MTITATPSEISYAGDDASTVFPITFPFDTAADLKVLSTDPAGNVSVLTTGFSVAGGAGSTGSLTLGAALASGYTLTILDDPLVTQNADYVSNDPFAAKTHERALDRGVRISKRLSQIVGRTLRLGDGNAVGALDPVSGPLPGQFLAFDALGRPRTSAGTGADAGLRTDLASTSSGSDGSLLVGFRRTDTDAIGRALADRLRERVSVKDFGAVGDGNANDTQAIQNAIDASERGRIFLPAGTYKITDTLTITYTDVWHSLHLYGEGHATKIIWAGGNGKPMLHIHGVSGAGWYSKSIIERLYLYGNSFTGDTYTDVIGIQIGDTPEDDETGVVNLTIRNCTISHTSIGILGYYESDEMTIEDNYIERFSGYGIWNKHGGSNWRITKNHLSDGHALSTGIRTSLSSTTIDSNTIQGEQFSIGIQADGDDAAKCVTVTNNYIESQLETDYGVLFFGVQTGKIGGNIFNGCRGATLIALADDADSNPCRNIGIGPNHHNQSGGVIAALISVAAASENCAVLGVQQTDGAVTTISGPLIVNIRADGIATIGIAVGSGALTVSESTSVAAFGSHPQPKDDATYTCGAVGKKWARVFTDAVALNFGIPAPAALANHVLLFVDQADGLLKYRMADGTLKVIATV